MASMCVLSALIASMHCLTFKLSKFGAWHSYAIADTVVTWVNIHILACVCHECIGLMFVISQVLSKI